MKVSLRKTAPVIVLAILIVAVAVGGYVVVHNRAHSSGIAQTPISLHPPSPSPGVPHPSPSPVDRWMVGKATKTVVAYAKPSASAKVKIRLPRLNIHTFPSLVLVHSVKTINGVPWYDVWLPVEAVHETVTRDIPALAVTPLGTEGELQERADTAGLELADGQVPAALEALTT